MKMSRQWNLAFQIDHGYERLSEMSMVENKLFAEDIRQDNNPQLSVRDVVNLFESKWQKKLRNQDGKIRDLKSPNMTQSLHMDEGSIASMR